MNYKYLMTEENDGVGLIKINNPKANTISSLVVNELVNQLDSYLNNQEVKVIIITGYGDKFFISGAEITEFVDKDTFEGLELGKDLQTAFNKIENFPKPTIAAINGYCLGGGLELAMCCDIRYASKNAKMGQPEINLGLIPGAGGTQRLPRIVGKGKAKEIMYTGEFISADEALRIQLVQKVCSQEELLNEAISLAKKICSKSTLIIKLLKKTIDMGSETPLTAGLSLEADNFGLCFSTNDKKEGVSAFIEKRKPNFKGN